MTAVKLDLRPPLALRWSSQRSYGAVAGPESSLVGGEDETLAAIDPTGRRIWSRPTSGQRLLSRFFYDGAFGVVVDGPQPLTLLLDARTGREVRRLGWSGDILAYPFAICDTLRNVFVGSVETGEKLWERSFGAKANPKWVRVLAANKDVVVWGQGNGAVVCVKTATGETLWETSVAEAPHNDGVKRTPGVLLDKIHIMDDRVVFISMYEKRAVAIKSGKTLWRKVGGSNFSESVLVGDQIFLTGNDWLDTKTGDFYRGAPLESPRKLLGKRGVTAHFASGSHIFGSTNGNTLLMAWDRRTGALEWTHEPEGAFGTSYRNPLTSAYGRLYFVDFNGRTFCYEPGVSQETRDGLTVIQAAKAPTTRPSRTLPTTRKKSASVARKRVPKSVARQRSKA